MPLRKFAQFVGRYPLIVTLRPAVEHEVIRWVLGEAGNIEVLDPPELRRKIAAAGRRIMERNS